MQENTSSHERSSFLMRFIDARAVFICMLVFTSVVPILAGCDPGHGIPPELLGTWSRYEESNGLEYRYTFMQDGTFASATRDDTGTDTPLSSGTFSTTETTLVVDGDRQDPDIARRFHSEHTYYVNDSYYVYMAMLPEGDHRGLIGTWTGWSRGASYEGDELVSSTDWSMTIEILADGTATWTFTADGETSTSTGLYREIEPGFLYEIDSGLPFWSFDGRALGMWFYEPVNG